MMWFVASWRGLFRFACLLIALAVAATIPIIQLATLGYLLEVSKRRAEGRPWRETLPGLSLAGQLGWSAIPLLVTLFPAWLCAYFAYQAELIDPGSNLAGRWRLAAIILGCSWLLHSLWALMRGGRWRDFLWPAPVRFFREFFLPSTWRQAEDELWNAWAGLHLARLIWSGFRATIGTLLWLIIPAILMMIGMRADENPILALIGALGFFSMWLVLLYLPFLQTQFAIENRFSSLFQVATIRADFQRAPWAFFGGLLVTLGLAIPLYLLRIETIPPKLMWLPCVFFVLFSLPARIVLGWSMHRGRRLIVKRWWPSRYLAWLLQLVIVPIYILFLYLGSLASWDGPLVVIFQHAFLAPVPFVGQ
jgi:hypothetical protein